MAKVEAPPGYLVTIDAEGAEVSDRRGVTGLSLERSQAVREELERGMGPDCSVVFREY